MWFLFCSRLLLLNQFHDVLPGSCIQLVVRDALQYYAGEQGVGLGGHLLTYWSCTCGMGQWDPFPSGKVAALSSLCYCSSGSRVWVVLIVPALQKADLLSVFSQACFQSEKGAKTQQTSCGQ